MRPITKILLLAVVAFVVYLLWPRTGDMKAFDPVKLAGLEVESWQAQKAGKEFDVLTARFQIYSLQYDFDPISSFRIAQNQAVALESLKLSRGANNDPNGEGQALVALTEKYMWIEKQAKVKFDADAMAREELAWRLLEMEGASPAEIAAPFSRVLAGLYGGSAKDFKEAATQIAAARALILRGGAGTGQPDVFTAKMIAGDAYRLLKEIANAPIPPRPAR